MSKKEHINRSRRVQKLLKLISEGKNSQEIEDILAERREQGEYQRQRQQENENKVKQSIGALGIVDRVVKTHPFSADEPKGRDFKVHIDPDSISGLLGSDSFINSVWVQVKTREAEIMSFRSRFGDTPEEIESKLKEERIIILNSSDSPEAIRASFVEQLVQIGGFWRE